MIDVLSINSGTLYAEVLSKGRSKITKLYPDPITEINERKFATRTKASYAHIPEYYTLPINTPYVDKGPGPFHPYARYSKHSTPKWATSDQTPELLLEPFGDMEIRSWSTMAEMVDMHYKHLPFTIIYDDDVISVYIFLFNFLESMRSVYFTEDARPYVDFLNRAVAFTKELKDLYLSICKKRHIRYRQNIFLEFLQPKA